MSSRWQQAATALGSVPAIFDNATLVLGAKLVLPKDRMFRHPGSDDACPGDQDARQKG